MRNLRECCSRSCGVSLGMSRVDKEKFKAAISATRLEGLRTGRVVQKGHPHSEETKRHLSELAKVRLSIPENNPMFGKKRSDESRAKQSATRAARFVDGTYDWEMWSKSGYLETKKAGRVFCRSSWEMKAAEILEADSNVVMFKFEPFSIPYLRKEGDRDHLRHYIPDILVEYSDGIRKLLEIKPECYVDADVNVAKFSAARQYCDQNGILFEVWTQRELNRERLSSV